MVSLLLILCDTCFAVLTKGLLPWLLQVAVPFIFTPQTPQRCCSMTSLKSWLMIYKNCYFGFLGHKCPIFLNVYFWHIFFKCSEL